MKRLFNLISNIYFFIKEKSLPGVLIVVCSKTQNEKLFLLVKSYHSRAITFPSGNLNPFEDFFEAAVRELFEETGLRVKKDSLFLTPIVHKFKYKNLPVQINGRQKVFFLLLPIFNVILNVPDEDIEWVHWYDAKQTFSLLSYPELKITFKNVIAYLNKYEKGL